jgi:hypothetical protein
MLTCWLFIQQFRIFIFRLFMRIRLSHILVTKPIFGVGMARPFKEINPAQLEKLTSLYSDKEIGEKLGHSRWTITQARKRFSIQSFYEKTGLKRNVKGDDGVTYGGRKRSFTYNESFFQDLEGEAQAYYLGVLAADGCVHRDLDGVELTLQESDVQTLLDFKKVLGGTSPELYYKRKKIGVNAYRLTLCSKKMALDLNSWGISPAKTHSLEIKRPIPSHLLRHFLRGLWDGDGWIGESNFSLLTASEAFANQLQQMFYQISGVEFFWKWKKVRDTRYPIFEGSSKKHTPILQAMYQDCSYFMERKMEKFSRFWY